MSREEGLRWAGRALGWLMATLAIGVAMTALTISALVLAAIASEPVRAALADTLLYWRVLWYFARGGSYDDCPFLLNNDDHGSISTTTNNNNNNDNNNNNTNNNTNNSSSSSSSDARLRIKVYLHSLALIFYLWDKPHYRSGTFQNDMIKNLRNVAFPGTGVPLDWLCRSRAVFTLFLFLGMPLMFCAYAVVITRKRASVADVCRTYRQLLLTPEPWFAYWRLNCRLASYHALVTGCDDYRLEDKWSFLVAAEEKDIPVSPFLKVDSIVCKDRNEEGGMGIHFFKNALHGGKWIIQEVLHNSALLQQWLPDSAPLSTLRVITASTNALDVIDGEMDGDASARKEKVQSLSCVFRAGRAGASTDHSSVLFDTDVESGHVRRGTTNAHWYQLGVHDGLLRYRPAPTHDRHPDNGVMLTGNSIPDMAAIRNLVETAHATLLPGVPLCGWDVALTKEAGRCLLEVNLSCNFFNGTFDKQAYFALLDTFFARLDRKRRAHQQQH
ncbi:hypothetical protein PTSG_08380 [Salpingoeca rosetta]|uniref:Alpha-L-glutamate ligase-related protein ATP-grasp domain-containing protein n=1 Tax=Salpingoeca rosetta (strain ATCC 50818 / BSB-021) TaxID=946362 RepID=F2UJI8_SALR5|nr:uncharacterized protein PTSG_08380 [Salpingoeca rosetta]EGD77287.1 hypothetical protein PTSG_08380 [Salpingoeca rosetta]|eukprot:XP_004990631.1 hypothetical protein PTSG_08380 [Salpingoeca rosetta]